MVKTEPVSLSLRPPHRCFKVLFCCGFEPYCNLSTTASNRQKNKELKGKYNSKPRGRDRALSAHSLTNLLPGLSAPS